MSNISMEDYCPHCENFDANIGVCSEIKENVRSYPKKFIIKCSGKYYKGDNDKIPHNNFNISETKISETSENPKSIITFFLKHIFRKAALIFACCILNLIGMGLCIYGLAENPLFLFLGVPFCVVGVVLYNKAKKMDSIKNVI